ncbi:MAG: outer membrane beta-barrel protein [Schleiferiaceae bacterium]|nr:outer membrane beta-barrel protein [Schleiferiaceae bacterium]
MRLLMAATALFVTTALSAQDFYFNPVVGYGINAPGEVNTTGDTGSTSIDNLNLGGGVNVGVSGGFLFDDIFGIEARLNYQNNFGYQTVRSTTIQDPSSGQQIPIEQISTFNASSIRLAPLLFFRMDEDVSPYAKVGPILQYSMLSVVDESPTVIVNNNTPAVGTLESETQLNNGISLGALGEAGMMFELDNDIFLNAGIAFSAIQVSPNSSEIVRYEENGQDQLDDLNTSEKETEFVETINNTSSNDPDQPSQQLKNWLNYSSFSLRVGVIMIL